MRKKAALFCFATAFVLFLSMCAAVVYEYARMQCAIAHGGAVVPVSVAFLLAMPFLLAVVVCLTAGFICYKNPGRGNNTWEKSMFFLLPLPI